MEDNAEYIAINIHREDNIWWADSPDLPGFTRVDNTKQGLINRCRTAVEEILGSESKRLGTFVWVDASWQIP